MSEEAREAARIAQQRAAWRKIFEACPPEKRKSLVERVERGWEEAQTSEN